MEMFSLCKDIGYLRNYFIFVGKNGEPYPEEKELEKRIETSIIKELLGCGCYLYVDTVAAGTVRKNRIYLSTRLKKKSWKKMSMISEEIKIFYQQNFKIKKKFPYFQLPIPLR